jgi:hypothetical protein
MTAHTTPSQWRLRAEETRAIADGMYGAEAKRILLTIADEYDAIAARLEREQDAPLNDDTTTTTAAPFFRRQR